MNESRKQKAESRKQKAESRKQKAESRKQKAENNSNCRFECQSTSYKKDCKLHNFQREQGNKCNDSNRKWCNRINVIMDRREIFRKTEIACTICARDYKGFGMTCMNGVIEIYED